MSCHRAYVEFRSIMPYPAMPDFFSIGGYYATSQDGREFGFDWTENNTEIEYDEEGHMILGALVKNLDDCYKEENLKAGVKQDELTAEFLSKSKFSEIFYECGYCVNGVESEEGIVLELSGIEFSEWNDAIMKYEYFALPEKEVSRYNKEEGMQLNFSVYKQIFLDKKKVLDDVEAMLETEKDFYQQRLLANKIVDDSFQGVDGLIKKSYNFVTILIYLMYYFHGNLTIYSLTEDFIHRCKLRERTLNGLG